MQVWFIVLLLTLLQCTCILSITDRHNLTSFPLAAIPSNMRLDLAFLLNPSSHRKFEYDTGRYLDKRGSDAELENPGPLPWHCEDAVRWRNLGNLHFPQYIRETICVAGRSTCMHGFYTCSQVYYPVNVLSLKEIGDPTNMHLPNELRNDWVFRVVNVSVGCMCSVQ